MKKSHYNISLPLISLARTLLPGVAKFPSDFLFFNSGRSTIKWLLSELKKTSGHKLKVGMPCYACYTVYQAALESGNEIVLLDVDPLNFTLTGKLKSRLRDLDVIIWINYFGFRYSGVIKEIRTRYPGLIIVEDCSHVDLRDYIKTGRQEIHSDYSVFSFNFGKPITIGGGGLLVPNEERNIKSAEYLYNSFNQLPSGKPGPKELIRRFKYHFSFIYLIFLYFKEHNTRRGTGVFKPEEVPIKTLSMDKILKKLIYAQFLMSSEKKSSEHCTLNYFNKITELFENYSFGSLSYYPVLRSAADDIFADKKIDKFLLWGNITDHYKYFDIDISEEAFPLTFKFLSGSIFLPARFFNKPGNRKIGFPLIS